MQIIFASNNKNKIFEIQRLLPDSIKIITLAEAGIEADIPEPYDTLEENAEAKCDFIYHLKGSPCFSEDTGLEVEALQGAPGVQSARYAGPERLDEKNIHLLLANMQGKENRQARFRTVICLHEGKEKKYFEGICEGKIDREAKGLSGFGYDPVFIPDGSTITFAEMGVDEKSKFSHRKKALAKLLTYLTTKK